MVLHNLLVFYCRQGHAPHPVKVDGDTLDQGINLRLPGDVKQNAVKLIVQLQQVFRIVAVEVELLQLQIVLQTADILGSSHLTIQFRHRTLQQIPHEVGLLHQFIVDQGNYTFSLGVDLDDFYLGQLDQRFPHRSTGQIHLCRQLILADLAARLQLQGDNIIPNCTQSIVPPCLSGQSFQNLHERASRLTYR